MRRLAILSALATLLCAPATPADENRRETKRDAIYAMAVDTLERLFREDPAAGDVYDKAIGWAVFDNLKVAVLVSGGGGVGVAVDRETHERTYMKMGSAGIGFGLGGQSYQVVFFFETEEAFQRFLEKGWSADVAANAVAGGTGINRNTPFADGIAVYQLTNKGLLAQADVSGTKYWRSRKLNR